MAVQDDEDPQLSGEGEPQPEKVSSGKIFTNQERLVLKRSLWEMIKYLTYMIERAEQKDQEFAQLCETLYLEKKQALIDRSGKEIPGGAVVKATN